MPALPRLRLSLHNEPLPLAHPFRISGYVFEAMPATVVALDDGTHDGRGEAAGVYYLDDVPERMLATLEAHRDAIEAGLTREEARALLPAGGARNALQRLWMRGVTLDRGEGHAERWALVRGLSEDAMVQIFERASISGEYRLARSIAEAWVSTAANIGRGRMEDVMRRATKYIRVRNQIYDLASLEDDALHSEISRAFGKVIELDGTIQPASAAQ